MYISIVPSTPNSSFRQLCKMECSIMSKAVERSHNVRATAFPKATDVDMSFWIFSSAIRYQVFMCLICKLVDSKAHHPNQNS